MSKYNEQHATIMLNALIGTETLANYNKEIRAKVIEEILNKIDEGVCELCEHASEDHTCYKWCKNNDDKADYERDTFVEWLKEQKNE